MTGRILVAIREQMRDEYGARQLVVVRQESDDILPRPLQFARRDVNLRTIAGGQDDGLGRGRTGRERLDSGTDITAREVEPLAQIDRRGAVTDAYQDQMHVNAARQAPNAGTPAPRERAAWSSDVPPRALSMALSVGKRVAGRDEVIHRHEVEQDDREAERRQPRRAPAVPSEALTSEHRERIERPRE